MGPGHHKSENTVTICELGAREPSRLGYSKWGGAGVLFCVGLGVLVGNGWVEDAAELGDEGKAAGSTQPAALLSVLRPFCAGHHSMLNSIIVAP
jgi:hypothetical protein